MRIVVKVIIIPFTFHFRQWKYTKEEDMGTMMIMDKDYGRR